MIHDKSNKSLLMSLNLLILNRIYQKLASRAQTFFELCRRQIDVKMIRNLINRIEDQRS